MAKIEMVNVHNNHFPLGGITQVEIERISELELLGFELLNKKEQVVEEKPSEKWTEKNIKNWMEKHSPELSYNIVKEKKLEKLEELKLKGYI
ncbi:MAG: hypothetical protein Q7R52_04400 [archaeon]|nr:hypothetical protein [archaeon]